MGCHCKFRKSLYQFLTTRRAGLLRVTDCELALVIICRSKKGDVMVGRNLMLTRKYRDWFKAALQPAMLFYLLMIPALWAALTVILQNEQERTLDTAVQQGSNLARLFEQNTTAMLQGVDRTLLLLRQEYERNPDEFDLSRLVKRATYTDDLTIQFAIAGRTGDAIGMTSPNGAVTKANFADRQWFQQQRGAKNDELIISTPVERSYGADGGGRGTFIVHTN